jgi:predicted MFS family arabinose efflux permease
MYIALEIGIGSGALAAGSLFADRYHLVPTLFYGTAALTTSGLIYLLVAGKKAETNRES